MDLKKIYYSLLLLALLFVAGCTDPLEDKLFEASDRHFRFEYFLGQPGPRNIPVDTATVTLGSLPETVEVPIAFSTLPFTETSTLRFSADISGNLLAADEVSILENGELTDYELTFAPGQYEQTLTIKLSEDIDEEGYVHLVLTESSPSSISLGFPGPNAERKTFTLLIEAP